jgi:hypothetical protein
MHTNVSTKKMREEGGISVIKDGHQQACGQAEGARTERATS